MTNLHRFQTEGGIDTDVWLIYVSSGTKVSLIFDSRARAICIPTPALETFLYYRFIARFSSSIMSSKLYHQ